jgi:hypothetical protein
MLLPAGSSTRGCPLAMNARTRKTHINLENIFPFIAIADWLA